MECTDNFTRFNKGQRRKINRYSIARIIAYIYIFLLPIRMIGQFSGFKEALHGAAIYIDIIFHIIGLALILFQGNVRDSGEFDKSSRMVLYFFLLVFYLNASSLVAAGITQLTQGSYAGETAFSGILGMVIYFFQYALMLYYNRYVLHILSKTEINSILFKVIIFLLVLGYFQILVISFEGPFYAIYEAVDVFDIFADVTFIHKLSLTGSEGASAGTLSCVFIFPYLYANFLTKKKNTKYLILIFAFIPVLIFMRSSTCYTLFFISLCVFLYFAIKMRKIGKYLIFVFGIFLLIFGFVVIYPQFLSSIFPSDFVYLLFGKVFDLSNGSTAARTVPLYINWGAFTESPIFGVGNGLQGYYYTKYFPEWGYNFKGSDIIDFLNTAKTTISNGGVFIPSLLSGYGIVGILLICVFLSKYIKYAIANKERLGLFYYIFIIGSISFLVTGFQGEFNGLYYAWFIFSLPLARLDEIEAVQ